jgi:hypothetical protein
MGAFKVICSNILASQIAAKITNEPTSGFLPMMKLVFGVG